MSYDFICTINIRQHIEYLRYHDTITVFAFSVAVLIHTTITEYSYQISQNSVSQVYNLTALQHININHRLYSSPNIIWVIKSTRLRWAGHVARMEEGRSAFKILTGKPTGKRPLGRPTCRWMKNIRIDPEETGINTGDWVDWAQDKDY